MQRRRPSSVLSPVLAGSAATLPRAPRLNDTQTSCSFDARDSSTGREAIGEAIRIRVGEVPFRMWFESQSELAVDGSSLDVAVRTTFASDWIERHYRNVLESVMRERLGPAAKVTIRAAPQLPQPTGARARRGDPERAIESALPERERRTRPGSEWRTFDDFVAAPSNRIALESARQFAAGTLPGVNLLVLHGPCGVGKTHLLHALCSARQSAGSARVRYLTGEQFTNGFLAALRANTVSAFRQRVRECDLLAIDDVHFLADKTATQAEFLHTIDAVGLMGAKVAIVSDEHPREIARLSKALVSRLLAGIVAKVDAPDRDLRNALVRRFAQRRGLRLTDAAIDCVASRCVGSVREIEGAVAKLAAVSVLDTRRLQGEAINESSVTQVLDADAARERRTNVRIPTIIDAACEALGVERSECLGASRHRRAVLARGVIALLAREFTTRSYPEIAKAMGRSTHSTIHAAASRVQKFVEQRSAIDAADGSCGADELVARVRRSVLAAPRS